MKRPLLAAVVFLSAGIIFGRYAYPAAGLYWLFAGTGVAALCLWFMFRQRLIAAYPLLAVLGFTLILGSIRDRCDILRVAAEEGVHLAFTGTVIEAGQTGRGRPRAIIRTDVFIIDGVYHEMRVDVLAYLDFEDETAVGNIAAVEGTLRPLRFRRNPGGYDEFTFLRSRGIQYTIFPDAYNEEPGALYLPGLPAQAGARLQAVLRQLLPADEAGVLIGILFGDRTGIDSEIQDNYRAAGVFHILAVSGLHVSLIAMSLMRSLSKTPLGDGAAAAITLIFLVFYCVMTGANPGTVRASLMYGVHLIGIMLFKRSDGLNSISFAALVLLLFRPLYLWDIGFQFSFTAAAGLIVGTPAMLKALDNFSSKNKTAKFFAEHKFFREHGAAVVVATAVTFPIAAFYFYRFPIIGLVTNLLIMPTVVLTVSAGFAAALIGLVNIGVAGLLAVIPRALIQFYGYVTALLGELSFATVFTGRPAHIVIFAYYGAFALIAWAMGFKERNKRNARLIIRTAAAACAVIVIIGAAVPEPMRITALDVGRGRAVVVSKGGQALIIDGGGRSLDRIGDDTGVWTLLPYLQYLGIEQVEAAFVSYSHPANAIGIIEAIEAGAVERLYLAHTERHFGGAVYRRLIQAALAAGTEVLYIGAGYVRSFDNGLTVSALYPHAGAIGAASLALMLEANGTRVLFTGDQSPEAQYEILEIFSSTNALSADVIKLPRDGRVSPAFIRAVNPAIALGDAGHDIGIPVFSTESLGAVWIYPRPGELRIRTMAGLADERTKRSFEIR